MPETDRLLFNNSTLPPLEDIYATQYSESKHIEKESGSLPPLNDISIGEIQLDNIKTDYISNDHSTAAKSIANQIKLDDISLEMSESVPLLEDLSAEYKPTYNKAKADEQFRPVEKKSEQQLIKERLQREINRVPDQVDKKESLALYNKLMEEKKIKDAHKGLVSTIFVMIFGIMSACISYFFLDWSSQAVFKYLAFAAMVFSLLLLIKLKFVKVLCTLFFAANTLVLLIPGVIMFAIQSELAETNEAGFIKTLILLVAATLLSAASCFQLATSDKIEAFYSTKISSK